MKTQLAGPVQYTLSLGDTPVNMNEWIGKSIELHYSGAINCVHCDRKTNKSFNQGFCYPCFKRLAQCDSCIVSPEKCHYEQGTCREPEWGEANCLRDHFVYLANTSGLKVGITRGTQIPTRWMDQGATQALPIFRVDTRLLSGLVEVTFKDHIADKTNWQAMLKGNADDRDMVSERDRLLAACSAEIDALHNQHGLNAITPLTDEEVVSIQYPVEEFPLKVKSFNLDKTPEISGTLMGIKGQYLIFDTGVINMRKYGGYHVALRA
ncbi:MAG: DUF2797 domain-containing protein [Halioglobus sp.]